LEGDDLTPSLFYYGVMMMSNNRRVVILWSGGIDSTTLVWWAKKKGMDVRTLTIYYGQKHTKETSFVAKLTEKFRIDNKTVDLGAIQPLIDYGALTGTANVPQGTYDEKTQRVTIVPNRNMILLAIAAGYAITLGSSVILYAAHRNDRSIYPDCRPVFVNAMNAAIEAGNVWSPVEIWAPFIDYSKTEIVTLGLKLDVPYEDTWSCYEGGRKPCGKCGTCLERTEAFMNNVANDPALNPKDWIKFMGYYKDARISDGNKT